jgi:hypothetical protein
VTLHELQRRTKSFNIREAVIMTVEQTTPEILEFNRAQLLKGRRSDDTEIWNLYFDSSRTSYGEMWGEHRLDHGLQVEHYDLKFTGKFHASIFVENININSFSVTSRDHRAYDIEKMFSNKIYGLSSESRGLYARKYFQPILKHMITTATKLQFT